MILKPGYAAHDTVLSIVLPPIKNFPGVIQPIFFSIIVFGSRITIQCRYQPTTSVVTTSVGNNNVRRRKSERGYL